MSRPRSLLVLGANNLETVRVVAAINDRAPVFDLVGFLDNDPAKHGTTFRGYPVLGLSALVGEPAYRDCVVVNAITRSPLVRKETTEELLAHGATLTNLIHPSVDVRFVTLGTGIICRALPASSNFLCADPRGAPQLLARRLFRLVPDRGAISPVGAMAAGITAQAESAGAAPSATVPSSPEATAGSPPPSTREIHGHFTSPNIRTSMRLWRGPNDYEGFERLTRLTIEVDGVPEYSMAVSAVQIAGVCRCGNWLDHLLLVFHSERRGGERFGLVRYDTKKGRFALNLTPGDITQDAGVRLDCSGGRVILPEGAPGLPCTCPWRDDPDNPSPRSATDATTDTREIHILPEEPGGTP